MAIRFTTDWRSYSVETRAAAIGLRRYRGESDDRFEDRVDDEEEMARGLEDRARRRRTNDPFAQRKHLMARRSQSCGACRSWHAPIVTCEQAAKGWGVADVCDD